MKTTKLIIAAAGLFAATTLHATTWTVSNNPDRPAQFTTVQQAVNAASPNDTILITGGTYSGSAGNMTTTIPLVLYGEGIRGNTDFPETRITSASWVFSRLNSSLSSSGSRIYGIDLGSTTISINGSFSGSQTGQTTMSDFIIERCAFSSSSGLAISVNDGVSNVTVRNCLFGESSNGGGLSVSGQGNLLSNIVYTNCIFSSTSSGGNYFSHSGSLNGNVVVRNSLFLNNTSNSFSSNINQLIIENCIFYKSEPTGCNNCTFNNNLTYLANNNALPYGNNLGSGNIVNQNPLFVTFPALGAPFSWDHNYALQAGSPALGTGTNGIDMGLNSGNAPVSQIPQYAKIPAVTNLNIPVSSVPVGGTLQINVEAISRD